MLRGPKARGTIDFGCVSLSLCENETLLILKACIVPGSQTWRCLNHNLLEKDTQIKFIKCSKVTPNTVAAHLALNMLGLRKLQLPTLGKKKKKENIFSFVLVHSDYIISLCSLLCDLQCLPMENKDLSFPLTVGSAICPTDWEQK